MSNKFERLLRLFFPERCVICGRVTDGAPICGECTRSVTLCRDVRSCKKCSRPVAEGHALCALCQTHPRRYAACFAAAVYEGAMRRSLHRYKFYRHPEYHRGYARLLLEHLASFESLPRFDVAVGTPVSAERLRERGYSQSELLARAVAKGLGVPYAKGAIRKIRHTPAQSSLSFEERQKNVVGAFRVEKPELVAGRTVLLVDDILTTGATADEISRILLRAKAKAVYVAVPAIAPSHEESQT